METEALLLLLQQLSNRPYPEPFEPSPNPYKIHFSRILPSTSSSPKWSLPFEFPDQSFVCISHHPMLGTYPPPIYFSFILSL